jgi:hypothetical protein
MPPPGGVYEVVLRHAYSDARGEKLHDVVGGRAAGALQHAGM